MSAPVWTEDADSSSLDIGTVAAPVTVYVDRWPHRPEFWSASVQVGTEASPCPIHRSGHKAPGHPSREAAKARGLEALSIWLRAVAEGTSAAMGALPDGL